MKSNSSYIIADSSGIISLLNDEDRNHQVASKFQKSFLHKDVEMLIAPEILSEVINIMGKKFGHLNATKAYKFLIEDKQFVITESNEQLRNQAIEKFQSQAGSVSYTDCIVMALADLWQTKQIFGFDEAFRKNGYTTPG